MYPFKCIFAAAVQRFNAVCLANSLTNQKKPLIFRHTWILYIYVISLYLLATFTEANLKKAIILISAACSKLGEIRRNVSQNVKNSIFFKWTICWNARFALLFSIVTRALNIKLLKQTFCQMRFKTKETSRTPHTSERNIRWAMTNSVFFFSFSWLKLPRWRH